MIQVIIMACVQEEKKSVVIEALLGKGFNLCEYINLLYYQ